MAGLILRAYKGLRNFGRSVIVRHPLLERVFAGFLVRLESFLPLQWFVRKASNPLIHDGNQIWHRPDDIGVTLSILFHGEYEPETTRILKQILRPGMAFVDCGAHIGYFTLLAARAVAPNGKVYAFEPGPQTFELLVENVKVNGYEGIVSSIPKAVSNGLGRVRIFLNEKSSVSAKLLASHYGQTSIEVEAVSLDEFFREESWPQVHLVKMDIEGAEKAALEGMKELSRRNAEIKLIIEVNFQNLVRTGNSLEEFLEALQACGFSRFRVLWRQEVDLEVPKDIPRLAAIVHRVNVNLLCEKP